MFFDPDNECMYTVWHKNLEYRRGRNGGWCLIGCPADEKLDDEPLIDLIAETSQNADVEIVRNEKTD